MRAIHEYDCDFQTIGVCTCGAVNKCRRLGGCNDLTTHDANLKKFKALLESEKNPPAPAPVDRVPGAEQAPPAGGDPGASV